ncbi:MAG: Peptide-methionine (R)-S-oxide reductase MsrB, partial [uncultured Sphingomonadaceae bacterium]
DQTFPARRRGRCRRFRPVRPRVVRRRTRELRGSQERCRLAAHPAARSLRRTPRGVDRATEQQPAQRREAARHLRLRGLRAARLRLGRQVRERHRLAELHRPLARRGAHQARFQGHPAAHGGPLPSLRRAPRPRLQRRPGADRQALLHERCRHALRGRL